MTLLTQSVVHGPAALPSPGSFIILGSTAEPKNQNPHYGKILQMTSVRRDLNSVYLEYMTSMTEVIIVCT